MRLICIIKKSISMCSYKTWFHDDSIGYTVQCEDCQNLQIGFGNVMLTLSFTAFSGFREMVNQEMEAIDPTRVNTSKCIILSTPCSSINLLLSTMELIALQTMLETADNEMKADHLLSLFEK